MEKDREVLEEVLGFIRQEEGLRLEAYQCAGGVWTVGYGHTRTARQGMKITQAVADLLFREDVNLAARAVAFLVKVPLSDYQFGALVSFVFNVGRANFEKSSLLRLLNRGWYDQVPAQLLRWDKAQTRTLASLARRRVAEGALWRKGSD